MMGNNEENNIFELNFIILSHTIRLSALVKLSFQCPGKI